MHPYLLVSVLAHPKTCFPPDEQRLLFLSSPSLLFLGRFGRLYILLSVFGCFVFPNRKVETLYMCDFFSVALNVVVLETRYVASLVLGSAVHRL